MIYFSRIAFCPHQTTPGMARTNVDLRRLLAGAPLVVRKSAAALVHAAAAACGRFADH